MDTSALRDILRPLIGDLKDRFTHEALSSFCVDIGMPVPDSGGSKRERLQASFDSLMDVDVPKVANQLIERGLVGATTRNRVQDLLWMDDSCPVIPLRYRRELARSIERVPLYGDARRFNELLQKFWIIENDPWASLLERQDNSLAAQIDRHVFRNQGDWTVDYLFDQIGVYDAADQRFARFVEGMATGEVRPDISDQLEFVDCANQVLSQCGAHLREVGVKDGYPKYSLVSLYAPSNNRPKN